MMENCKSKTKDTVQVIVGLVIQLYILVSQIMALIFLWKMIKEDSFVMAMFIDPFIAELKGILWPFFI